MTKFNYREPEFKVVAAMSEDVITTSEIEQANSDFLVSGEMPFTM
jgi:hypothetical protein